MPIGGKLGRTFRAAGESGQLAGDFDGPRIEASGWSWPRRWRNGQAGLIAIDRLQQHEIREFGDPLVPGCTRRAASASPRVWSSPVSSSIKPRAAAGSCNSDKVRYSFRRVGRSDPAGPQRSGQDRCTNSPSDPYPRAHNEGAVCRRFRCARFSLPKPRRSLRIRPSRIA